MPEIQQLSDSMFAAGATVLGRLVDQPAAAGGSARNDHEGSIRTDGAELVTLTEIPSLGVKVVVRFPKAGMQKIVGMMLGGVEDEATEMGAMQLSIASETVSQIAAAMCEQFAKDVGASPDGVRAELCTDATSLPPPPFESYEDEIQVGSDIAPKVTVDFAAITLSQLGGATASEPAAPVERPSPPAKPPSTAQSVAFAPLAPTAMRTAPPGQANLDMVHDVPLQISAVLGRAAMALREVVSLQAGSVFELDKASAEPIDLYVNNILIARGEVVVVDDKYAVKISELNPSAG
jgi:flagellar motor switch protein FliN/FliY